MTDKTKTKKYRYKVHCPDIPWSTGHVFFKKVSANSCCDNYLKHGYCSWVERIEVADT